MPFTTIKMYNMENNAIQNKVSLEEQLHSSMREKYQQYPLIQTETEIKWKTIQTAMNEHMI